MNVRSSPKSSSSRGASPGSPACLIRRAAPCDVTAMAGLLAELFGIEEDFAADTAKQREGLELLLKRPDCLLLAAELDGEVVGMSSCQMLVSTAEGAPVGLVEDVVVRSDKRGQGIGPLLMDALITWAREQGATRLQLLADRNNAPALKFYADRGWQRTQLVCLRLAPHLSGKDSGNTVSAVTSG